MKFSIPSLSQILESISSTFKRFPIVLSLAFLGTLGAILLVEIHDSQSVEFSVNLRIFVICLLGISFSFATDIFTERSGFEPLKQNPLRLGVLVLLAIYYFLNGDGFAQGPHEVWFRYILFVLAAHLMVAFAPFTKRGDIDQFWEYNKSLFLRILLSALYSAALFIGLSIAMLAIDNLLGVDIKPERYLQLFIFQVGMFNTFFFLSGVPNISPESKLELVYPKGLKLFVQYVLIPLVSIYILILYMYLIKIVFQWELPNGWVSNLVLSFSIAGILSLLLLYPIRNDADQKWILAYSKGYYIALIPLIVLLMISIGTRISEYGVTVPRYFVATLGVWLSGIVLYFLFSKAKSIKMIPVTLCGIALVTSFGPIGAFAVSERSQLGRFNEILSEAGRIDPDGQVLDTGSELEFSQRKELSSVVFYIIETHGVDVLQDHFKTDFKSSDDTVRTASDVFKLMNLEFVSRWETENSFNNNISRFRYTTDGTWFSDLQEFDAILGDVSFNNPAELTTTFENSGQEWSLNLRPIDGVMDLYEQYSEKSISVDLKEVVSTLEQTVHLKEGEIFTPRDKMIFDFENDDLKLKIMIKSIRGYRGEDFQVDHLSFEALTKIKE